MTVVADAGLITGVYPDDLPIDIASDATVVDAAGRWLLPSFIDSHVHAAYLQRIAGYPDRGVAGAVDLGMPLESMSTTYPGLQVIVSGPILTSPQGYPTQTWGRNGYGVEVAEPSDADGIVGDLTRRGASVIKIALSEKPTLSEDTARAIVVAAHSRGMKVAAHAVSAAAAELAGRIDVDVLAHIPIEPLPEATLEMFRGRAVVSTLQAFGSSPAAMANIAALRDHGATVLFGTDFGNTTHVGIAPGEVHALLVAGFDMIAIVDMATRIPAEYWGFTTLGSIAPGKAASFFLTADPPTERADTLTVPIRVFVDGVEHRP
jgi:imidazolonepropionase-like amidohydrolase